MISGGTIMRAEAVERGMSITELAKFCEQDFKIDIALDKRQQALGASTERLILESRLAWHNMPEGFKILITCDRATRIARIAERDGVPYEEAFGMDTERTRADTDRYYYLYGYTNYLDPCHYDMAIDSSWQSVDALVESIIEQMEQSGAFPPRLPAHG